MQRKMDVTANNLANVDKTAFKKDTVAFKSFPELLIHRMNDDGIGWTPMGSFDISPLVGKLGTGVEVNEIFTRFEQGPLKHTKSDSDLALNGEGFMVVQTDRGARLSRSGAFYLDKNGYLVNSQGFPLLGESGPIKVNRNNYVITREGDVYINGAIGNNPEDAYGKDANNWENRVLLDRIQIRKVDYPRHLYKEGDSFYNVTPESGPMKTFTAAENPPEILQGFLETSNVNVVTEMVNMIEVQRAYELNQKSITTHDGMLSKLINEVPR